jgi:N-ethylmaleimide reductase
MAWVQQIISTVSLNSKHVYAHVMDGLAFGYHNLCPALTRKVYTGYLIGNSGYTKKTAEAAIRAGDADMIAFARPYI